MENYYRGKSAIITGGSSGIGLALAEQLAGYGTHVTILARRADILEDARQTLLNSAPKDSHIQAYAVDVTDANALLNCIEESTQISGPPDILINSAGITHPGVFQELSPEIFRSMMEVNYFGTVNAIKAVLPHMLKRESGTIINISSGVGYINVYGYTAYGAAKYAVTGLSEALRMELKPKGIQVTLVFPPDTETPQLEYDQKYKPYVTKVITEMAGHAQPGEVAHEILTGARRKKYIIVPGGFETKFLYFLSKLLGREIFYAILDRQVATALKNDPSGKK